MAYDETNATEWRNQQRPPRADVDNITNMTKMANISHIAHVAHVPLLFDELAPLHIEKLLALC